MNKTKILIVEDDRILSEQLAGLLRQQDYQVDCSFDGEEGFEIASAAAHDLIVLDVMLPKKDGFSLLGMLRKNSQTPVIMLTAKGAEEERIKGLSHGADDYLTKPFNSTELILRIDAILRRSRAATVSLNEETVIELDELKICREGQQLSVRGTSIDLTPIQFELVWTLLLYRGEVLSKAFLYQAVLKRSFGPHDRSLDMHISRVRRKLIASGWPGERLRAVHNKGYCLS